MKNTYSSFDSTSLQVLDTALGIAELHAAVPPVAQPGPAPLQPSATSLPVLVRNLRRGHRCEDVVWGVLAGSALMLLALSL